MNKDIITPFKTWRSFIFGNLVLGFFLSFLFVDDYTWQNMLLGTIWAFCISMTQWLGNVWLQIKIESKYSWLNHPVQRLTLTFLSILIYSVFAYVTVQTLLNLAIFGEIPRYLYTINKYWLIPVFVSLLISTIAGSIGFFISWQKSVVEQERLKSEMLNYKYESLKNQINPHFLFNSLNVLSDLVYDDQKLAVKFIHQFSDIYRYVLEHRDKELVTIAEELAFIEKFAFLLQIRFDDKLEIKINLPHQDTELIVPLALQLLIENAVKHNVISNKKPLKITIERIDDKVQVSNSIQPKNSGGQSNKIGLKNLELQYQYFTDLPVKIEHTTSTFTVSLPILKMLKK